jgi:hypothetical protein
MLERQGKHGVSCTAFVPVLISPAQYQERTGLAYPDQGPVWVKKAAGVFGWGKWQLKEHEKAGRHKSVLCAFGDLLPTIDWKEEI